MYKEFSWEKIMLVMDNPYKFGIGEGDGINLIFMGNGWRVELDKEFTSPDVEIDFGSSDG